LPISVNWHSCYFFSCFGRLNVKYEINLNLFKYKLNQYLVWWYSLQYPRYSICSAKNSDLKIFTHIPATDWFRVLLESFLTQVDGLWSWYLLLPIIKIVCCLNVFHLLDKLKHEILKHIKKQAILIPMGKRLYFYFPMCHGNTIVLIFWASAISI
jgi:hypothetical protein